MFVSIKYDPERFKSLHSSVNTPHTGRTTRRSSMPDYTNTTITLSTKYNTNNSTPNSQSSSFTLSPTKIVKFKYNSRRFVNSPTSTNSGILNNTPEFKPDINNKSVSTSPTTGIKSLNNADKNMRGKDDMKERTPTAESQTFDINSSPIKDSRTATTKTRTPSVVSTPSQTPARTPTPTSTSVTTPNHPISIIPVSKELSRMTNEMKQMIDSMKKYNEGYVVPTTSSTPVSTNTEKLFNRKHINGDQGGSNNNNSTGGSVSVNSIKHNLEIENQWYKNMYVVSDRLNFMKEVYKAVNKLKEKKIAAEAAAATTSTTTADDTTSTTVPAATTAETATTTSITTPTSNNDNINNTDHDKELKVKEKIKLMMMMGSSSPVKNEREEYTDNGLSPVKLSALENNDSFGKNYNDEDGDDDEEDNEDEDEDDGDDSEERMGFDGNSRRRKRRHRSNGESSNGDIVDIKGV